MRVRTSTLPRSETCEGVEKEKGTRVTVRSLKNFCIDGNEAKVTLAIKKKIAESCESAWFLASF